MRLCEANELTLPPQVVANTGFPYEQKAAGARRFLAERGITQVRGLYGRPRATNARARLLWAASGLPAPDAANDAAAGGVRAGESLAGHRGSSLTGTAA